MCDPYAACPTSLAIAVSSNIGHHFEQQSLQLWSSHQLLPCTPYICCSFAYNTSETRAHASISAILLCTFMRLATAEMSALPDQSHVVLYTDARTLRNG